MMIFDGMLRECLTFESVDKDDVTIQTKATHRPFLFCECLSNNAVPLIVKT